MRKNIAIALILMAGGSACITVPDGVVDVILKPPTPTPSATPTPIVSVERPIGRLIHWKTPQGKDVYQYDTGYFDDHAGNPRFDETVVKHWPGISALYEARTGDAAIKSARLLKVSCKVGTWLEQQHYTQATYQDNGEPCSKVPDRVEWTLFFTGGYTVTFTYSNSGDAVSPYYHVNDPSGKQRSSAPANHPHCFNGQRVDIRYSHTPNGLACKEVKP